MSTITMSSNRLEQRTEALKVANGVRLQKASIKIEIRAGRRSIRDTLADPPPCFRNTTIQDLLMLTPRWGRSKVLHLLKYEGISPARRVMDLTEREREVLMGSF